MHRRIPLAPLKAREDKAIAAVSCSLRLLSPDGHKRLDGCIKTHIKKRIAILEEPQQAPGPLPA